MDSVSTFIRAGSQSKRIVKQINFILSALMWSIRFETLKHTMQGVFTVKNAI